MLRRRVVCRPGRYWKHREGFGPHALTLDWSGTMAAGSLKPNGNGWIHKDDQTEVLESRLTALESEV